MAEDFLETLKTTMEQELLRTEQWHPPGEPEGFLKVEIRDLLRRLKKWRTLKLAKRLALIREVRQLMMAKLFGVALQNFPQFMRDVEDDRPAWAAFLQQTWDGEWSPERTSGLT